MPRPTTAWSNAAAMWITAAGWAKAARARFGASWVVTPDAISTPEQTLGFGKPQDRRGSVPSRVRRLVPTVLETGLKDAAQMRRAWRFRQPAQGPWVHHKLAFVWQHHDIFATAGFNLARTAGCPLVLYVHAPQVWEAARWGVRRPLWGRLVERFGEEPQLRRADLVACVSDEVAMEVRARGVPEHRVLVAPMAVDLERFHPGVSGDSVRERHGLIGYFVVGWSGSFRKFHGLELVLDALEKLGAARAGLKLLLVGDGQERGVLEQQAASRGLGNHLVFTGAVGHEEMPNYVAAMDAALVIARKGEAFHYSPLKLREYMACGRATVLPRIGELGREFSADGEALFYAPGDTGELACQISRLRSDSALRAKLERAASLRMSAAGSWMTQVDRAMARLGAHQHIAAYQ